jgi:DNA-3-methyladenine glycosylase II
MKVGMFRIKPRLPLFNGLVRTIISQQLGEAAAWAIYTRLIASYSAKTTTLSTSVVANTPIEKITAQGLSLQKANLIKHLATEIVLGKLNLRQLAYVQDNEVIEKLTKYKGIGEWTANIFMMFSLGRIDVFPRNDLALRRAVIRAYNLHPKDEDGYDKISSRWIPYRTVASWYLWRSLGIDSI